MRRLPGARGPRRQQARRRPKRRGQSARRLHDGRLRPRAGLPRRYLHRRRPRGLLGLARQYGHRSRPKRQRAGQVRRRSYGVADQKVGGHCLRHAHPSHHLNHLSQSAVLHRHGAHARLAAAQRLHRPHPQHDVGAHRARLAHPHRLRQRRVLYQRLQVTRARRAHHGRPHRRRCHRFHCLVALRHVYHGRPAGRRADPRGHDDEHGQPVL